MTEMIALDNVTLTQFAETYNRYNHSKGKEKSPAGREVVNCVSHEFFLNPNIDVSGEPGIVGGGLIIVNVRALEDEKTRGAFI